MHKDELIMLHQVMAEVKDSFESMNPSQAFFQDYYSLKIEPTQLHKSKMEHKHAIFVLGQGIADVIREYDPTASSRIAARMKELAKKSEKEIEYLQ